MSLGLNFEGTDLQVSLDFLLIFSLLYTNNLCSLSLCLIQESTTDKFVQQKILLNE